MFALYKLKQFFPDGWTWRRSNDELSLRKRNKITAGRLRASLFVGLFVCFSFACPLGVDRFVFGLCIIAFIDPLSSYIFPSSYLFPFAHPHSLSISNRCFSSLKMLSSLRNVNCVVWKWRRTENVRIGSRNDNGCDATI